jgi:hypothetical protein
VAGVAVSQLAPNSRACCLAALLKVAQSTHFPSARPQLYEHVLRLLHELAAAPLSMEPTLSLLRSSNLILDQLELVGCAPLLPDVRSPGLSRVSSRVYCGLPSVPRGHAVRVQRRVSVLW